MKRFETIVGNEWKGWKIDDKTKIVKKNGVVNILTSSENDKIKITFNLSVLPVYVEVD